MIILFSEISCGVMKMFHGIIIHLEWYTLGNMFTICLLGITESIHWGDNFALVNVYSLLWNIFNGWNHSNSYFFRAYIPTLRGVYGLCHVHVMFHIFLYTRVNMLQSILGRMVCQWDWLRFILVFLSIFQQQGTKNLAMEQKPLIFPLFERVGHWTAM